jgi:heat shock protein HslJ
VREWWHEGPRAGVDERVVGKCGHGAEDGALADGSYGTECVARSNDGALAEDGARSKGGGRADGGARPGRVCGVSTPDPRLIRTWHLVSASDDKGAMDIDGANITLTIGKFTGGSSPCNGYSATVAGGVGVVYVQAFQSANGEDCPNQAATELDARYLAALQKAQFSRLAGGQLTLSSPTAALHYSQTALPLPDLEKTTWLLAELPATGRSHVPTGAYDPPVSLEFNGYNGLKVKTVCSEFTTHYTVSGTAVSVGTTLIGFEGTGCTSSGKALDDRLQRLLFSPFTADIAYAGGDHGTTLTIANTGAGLAAMFLPKVTG